MTRHLLVPMDDSDPARAALRHALTTFPGAEVTVVHAVDDLEAGYGGDPGMGDVSSSSDPEFFDDVRAAAAEHDASVEPTVLRGTAATAILEYADEADVDQIVIGSDGRAGVSRVLLGSVAEAVTRRSSVPVTIVP
ncbi:universal stress protein [Natrarchaeobius halalkaliphilus]|uniref:Universal stress protein n=1 Tax=Natrarchaeobius halalkaliphilus TaxID=1679091 RepID=A0A3N6N3K1_9EURY|nr:universal stress protein [Natrarchaeobius halalkaliphilus]RQG92702.1 universal stress protein [Natrarchaeobius halalkaliphilus]